MLKIILSMLLLGMGWSACAQIKIPALSPSVEISQKIGLTTASLSYSRPGLRGRTLIGEEGILLPGKKWRTGANATTRLSFSNDVEVDGQLLRKGAYALLSTPGNETWTLHFYEYEKLPYTAFFEKEAVLEVSVPVKQMPYLLETFSLHFENITLDAASLVLQWGTYKAEFSLKVKEHEAILTQIDKVLKGPADFDYFQAALYLHETQTDLPRALSYIQKVTADDSALFFQVYREALILKDLGRAEEAVVAAKRSKVLSAKAGNEDLVRLSQRIIDSAGE